MKLIWRHTLRSTAGNPLQAAVVLLTVVFATALIFAGFAMSDLFYDMTRAEYNRNAQDADIMVGTHSPSSELFSAARLEEAVAEKGGVTRLETFLKLGGIVKTDEVTMTALVEAVDLETYFNTHAVRFTEHYQAGGTDGSTAVHEYRAAVVGQRTAKEYGIKAGDVIEVYLATYNHYAKLRVDYVAMDEGVFASPSANIILTDFRSVGNLGQINAAYLTLDGTVSYDDYVEYLEELFPSAEIGEGDSETYVRNISDGNTTLFTVAVAFIVALMAFILATSYMIIGRNRISELVIFKAAGASPAGTAAVILTEVLWYALLGGLGGLLLGRFCIGVAGYVLLPPAAGGIKDVAWKYIVSLLLSIAVTVLSTLGSVISISKKTVREMTSDNAREAKRPNYIVGAVSALTLTGCAVGVRFAKGMGMYLVIVGLVISLAVLIAFATAAVLQFVAFLAGKMRVKGAFELATRTVKRNKGVRTVTSLSAALITFAFLVVQIIGLVNGALVPFRSRYSSADYVVTADELKDKEEIEKVEEILRDGYGIRATGYMVSTNMRFLDDEDREISLYGLSDFATLNRMVSPKFNAEIRTQWLESDCPIVLSRDMALRWNLKAGDTLTLRTVGDDFKDIIFTFTVVAFDETVTEWDQIGYVRFGDLSEVTNGVTYFVEREENADPADTFLALRDRVERLRIKGGYALPFDEWAYGAMNQSLSGVRTLLTLLQIAVYAVGILGIVNLSVAVAMDRQKELRVYRMTGMDKKFQLNYAFAEGLMMALAAFIAGVLTSFALNQILTPLGSVLDKYMTFPIFPWSALIAGGIGLVVITAVWVGTAVFTKEKTVSFNERL